MEKNLIKGNLTKVNLPKGMREAGYDMESYLHNEIERLTKENDELKYYNSALRTANDLLYDENKEYEKALAAYGDPEGRHILRSIDKDWDWE